MENNLDYTIIVICNSCGDYKRFAAGDIRYWSTIDTHIKEHYVESGHTKFRQLSKSSSGGIDIRPLTVEKDQESLTFIQRIKQFFYG